MEFCEPESSQVAGWGGVGVSVWFGLYKKSRGGSNRSRLFPQRILSLLEMQVTVAA